MTMATDERMTERTSARAPVSVMIFTLNEEIHLPSCLDALAWADDVIVVDSCSTDRTEAISRDRGARFYQNRFTGFGSQRNWALEHCAPKHEWILVLDADERVTPELATEIAAIAESRPAGVGGYRLKRRFYMWGRWLRYSSLYPNWVVRLIHRDRVRYVDRGHAETQTVEGATRELANDLIDENLRSIDDWFERQNRYARKEAEYELANEATVQGWGHLLSGDPLRRRAALKRLSWRMPFRPGLYFLYAYLWRRGFRDGRDGLVFCFMKALYQGMIVVKKFDAKRSRGGHET
ncbi:MAG TPA: glycosyltransferase family 2 protein, partial [Gemmatimonadaceae bacterium]|nr:glycosyltransferase family 2 protein [Gemmatimonadaceae bacterium]